MQYLFIGGCPRSGTTALVNYLNRDERMVVGMERFKYMRNDVRPESFDEDVFFYPLEEETNYRSATFYWSLLYKWRRGGVRIVGDKVPLYTYALPRLAQHFPDFRFVFLLRDLDAVANSFVARARNPEDKNWPADNDHRAALRHWNESLARLRRFVGPDGDDRVFVVDYESMFGGDIEHLEALYSFVGLDLPREVRRSFVQSTGRWSSRGARESLLGDPEREELARGRDEELETWCRSLVRHQSRYLS